MFNLKNSLLALAVTVGTAAIANQEFTPKLIIKNTGTTTLIFTHVSHSFWNQMHNSKNLVTRTSYIMNCDNPTKHEVTLRSSEIELVPNESITLDSIPEYFGNKTKLYFSAAAYPEALEVDDEGYHTNIPQELINVTLSVYTDRKAFAYPSIMKQARSLKKDLMISIEGYESRWPTKQQNFRAEEQLVDRA